MIHSFLSSNVARPAAMLAIAAVATLFSIPQSAHAAFGAAASDSFGVRANVAVLNLAALNVGPASTASGVAPGPYSQSTNVASLSANTLAVASLVTGLIVTDASSNVDGSAGAKNTAASAAVNGLNLTVVPGILLVPDLVHLGATTISSHAQVGGTPGALISSGGFVIEDLSLFVSGVGLLTINANAGPNSVILDALGIRIVANEQIVTGDGINSRGLTVNALHISINGALNVADADIVIAHSHAEQSVPAPGVGLAMASGLGIAGFRRRRS